MLIGELKRILDKNLSQAAQDCLQLLQLLSPNSEVGNFDLKKICLHLALALNKNSDDVLTRAALTCILLNFPGVDGPECAKLLIEQLQKIAALVSELPDTSLFDEVFSPLMTAANRGERTVPFIYHLQALKGLELLFDLKEQAGRAHYLRIVSTGDSLKELSLEQRQVIAEGIHSFQWSPNSDYSDAIKKTLISSMEEVLSLQQVDILQRLLQVPFLDRMREPEKCWIQRVLTLTSEEALNGLIDMLNMVNAHENIDSCYSFTRSIMQNPDPRILSVIYKLNQALPSDEFFNKIFKPFVVDAPKNFAKIFSSKMGEAIISLVESNGDYACDDFVMLISIFLNDMNSSSLLTKSTYVCNVIEELKGLDKLSEQAHVIKILDKNQKQLQNIHCFLQLLILYPDLQAIKNIVDFGIDRDDFCSFAQKTINFLHKHGLNVDVKNFMLMFEFYDMGDNKLIFFVTKLEQYCFGKELINGSSQKLFKDQLAFEQLVAGLRGGLTFANILNDKERIEPALDFIRKSESPLFCRLFFEKVVFSKKPIWGSEGSSAERLTLDPLEILSSIPLYNMEYYFPLECALLYGVQSYIKEILQEFVKEGALLNYLVREASAGNFLVIETFYEKGLLNQEELFSIYEEALAANVDNVAVNPLCIEKYQQLLFSDTSFALANFSREELTVLKGLKQGRWELLEGFNEGLFAKIQEVITENDQYKRVSFTSTEVNFLRVLLIENGQEFLSAKLVSEWENSEASMFDVGVLLDKTLQLIDRLPKHNALDNAVKQRITSSLNDHLLQIASWLFFQAETLTSAEVSGANDLDSKKLTVLGLFFLQQTSILDEQNHNFRGIISLDKHSYSLMPEEYQSLFLRMMTNDAQSPLQQLVENNRIDEAYEPMQDDIDFVNLEFSPSGIASRLELSPFSLKYLEQLSQVLKVEDYLALLMERGVNLQIHDSKGRVKSPVHIAAMLNNFDAVEQCIQRGWGEVTLTPEQLSENPAVKTDSVLRCAYEAGNTEMVELLESRGFSFSDSELNIHLKLPMLIQATLRFSDNERLRKWLPDLKQLEEEQQFICIFSGLHDYIKGWLQPSSRLYLGSSAEDIFKPYPRTSLPNLAVPTDVDPGEVFQFIASILEGLPQNENFIKNFYEKIVSPLLDSQYPRLVVALVDRFNTIDLENESQNKDSHVKKKLIRNEIRKKVLAILERKKIEEKYFERVISAFKTDRILINELRERLDSRIIGARFGLPREVDGVFNNTYFIAVEFALQKKMFSVVEALMGQLGESDLTRIGFFDESFVKTKLKTEDIEAYEQFEQQKMISTALMPEGQALLTLDPTLRELKKSNVRRADGYYARQTLIQLFFLSLDFLIRDCGGYLISAMNDTVINHRRDLDSVSWSDAKLTKNGDSLMHLLPDCAGFTPNGNVDKKLQAVLEANPHLVLSSLNNKGQSPLELAALGESPVVYAQYLDAAKRVGFDINAPLYEKGNSFLMLLLSNGELNLQQRCAVLFDCFPEVDVNFINRDLDTPLTRALKMGKLDLAELLITKGADVFYKPFEDQDFYPCIELIEILKCKRVRPYQLAEGEKAFDPEGFEAKMIAATIKNLYGVDSKWFPPDEMPKSLRDLYLSRKNLDQLCENMQEGEESCSQATLFSSSSFFKHVARSITQVSCYRAFGQDALFSLKTSLEDYISQVESQRLETGKIDFTAGCDEKNKAASAINQEVNYYLAIKLLKKCSKENSPEKLTNTCYLENARDKLLSDGNLLGRVGFNRGELNLGILK